MIGLGLLSVSQVLPVPAAQRWRGFRSPALLLRHPHGAGILHGAVRTGRLRPRGTGQRLHQRTSLRTQPDQRARGEGHGTPQDLQVSLHFTYNFQLKSRAQVFIQTWTLGRFLAIITNTTDWLMIFPALVSQVLSCSSHTVPVSQLLWNCTVGK